MIEFRFWVLLVLFDIFNFGKIGSVVFVRRLKMLFYGKIFLSFILLYLGFNINI